MSHAMLPNVPTSPTSPLVQIVPKAPARLQSSGKIDLLSPVVVVGLVRFADFAIAVLSGFALAILYVGAEVVTATLLYGTVIVIAALVALLTFDLLGLYSMRALAAFPINLPRLMLGWSASLAAAGVLIFFLKAGPELSRVWLAIWLVAGGAAFALERGVLSLVLARLRASGRLVRRAVIYGTGALTDDLLHTLENEQGSEIRVVGVFDDRSAARGVPSTSAASRLGTLDELLETARAARVDLVIVSIPFAGERRLHDVASRLSVLPADIRLPAGAMQLRLAPRLYSHVGSVAMLDLYDRPIADWGYVVKWLFDKSIGLAAVMTLAPVMLLVAAAIKLDSRGPVFFRQRRYGFNNELIEVFKFRSMHADMTDHDAGRLVTKGDPRVTRVGRFIRKTSLDELPQLFNVLKGDLSLVGPRPHAVSAKAQNRLYNEVVSRYYARHKVKPGITGWAQIRGWRGETDTEEKIEQRVEHDLYYIDNWSVFFDLYILAMTPIALFKSENAY